MRVISAPTCRLSVVRASTTPDTWPPHKTTIRSHSSSTFGLNQSFSDILTGIILFFIIGSEFFVTYQVSLRKSGKKEA